MAFIERAARDAAGDAHQTGCFLCEKAAADAEQDRENLILMRGERAYILMNLYPYNSGHLLVAPYTHTGDYVTLEPAVAAEVTALTQRCVAALTRAYAPQGFNVGMNLGTPAGAGIPDHLHAHVVPRWNGDTNFMPIIGQTKVLPESLEQTYDRLLRFVR